MTGNSTFVLPRVLSVFRSPNRWSLMQHLERESSSRQPIILSSSDISFLSASRFGSPYIKPLSPSSLQKPLLQQSSCPCSDHLSSPCPQSDPALSGSPSSALLMLPRSMSRPSTSARCVHYLFAALFLLIQPLRPRSLLRSVRVLSVCRLLGCGR